MHMIELPSLGARLCLRDSLAGRQLSPPNTERAAWDGQGGEGIPSEGVSVLPLTNSPLGQHWGIPHSPSLLQPAFRAALPVPAGWWLPAVTGFAVSPESETDVLLTKINSLMQE